MDFLYLHLAQADIDLFWPGIILLGLVVGFLTGLFGVGGGFLLAPALKFIFRIPFNIAIGSDVCQIFCTGGFSAWRHYRKNNVDLRLGVIMGLGAAAGAALGKEIMNYLKEQAGTMVLNGRPIPVLDLVLSVLFLILMGGIAWAIHRETSQATAEEETTSALARRFHAIRIPPLLAFPASQIESLSLWVPVTISFGVGILTGLLGIGGGFINFPLLVYVIGLPTSIAVGTSALQIVFATALSSVLYIRSGWVEFALVGLLLAGSLVGVQVGVHLSSAIGGRRLRRYFVAVIGLGILVILYGLAREIIFADTAGAGH